MPEAATADVLQFSNVILKCKTYHTAILQVLEQQSNVNPELKYVCGCVSTRNLGGPVDIQHAVSE